MTIERKYIKERLKSMHRDLVVSFAYRCALRALPAMAVDRKFEYWKEKKEDYLFSVFYVFDVLILNHPSHLQVHERSQRA